MNLAFKDILHNKLRFIMTSLGLGLLLTVVMAMSGIYAGLVFEASVLVETLGADLWVVQKDTFGPFADNSKISEIYGSVLGAINGVTEYNLVSFQTLQAIVGDNKKRLTIVGLKKEPAAFSNKIITGNYIKSSHYELVADISLGLKLNESIKLGYDNFKIVGLTSGVVNSSGEAVVFMTLQDAQKIQFQKNNEAIRNDKLQLKNSLNVNENSKTDKTKLEKIYNNHIINAIILSTDKKL
ncbi:MAG TPA: ABC transporter permease, partial [Candidatus Wallbacteria bacterium]|nr:ABC transporter permease [Candidatus Wallbacteria bacterium]